MFRQRFLDHDELTATVQEWARKHSDLVRLESIATTPEGRDVWMLTIGRDPDRIRPAVWVDGNMHAQELCGSSVALAIAEDVIALLTGKLSDRALGGPSLDTVSDVLFHIVPRISPDGAEAVIRSGQPVRSAPRLGRQNQQHPRWVSHDIDGDGQIRMMRMQDSGGELVASSEFPNLLVPRGLDDTGPFYRLFLEGTIENFDGDNIPNPVFLDDNDLDFNRNFPFAWTAPYKQIGAGPLPLSEPETRAVAEQATARPNLFAWLNLHTFGGVFIRPLGDKPDTKLHPEDLALYRQLGAWAEELTGYPMVSGFEEFTYEPDTPIYGDLSEWAFHDRGCVAYVVELWDLFAQVGLAKKKKFVDNYTHLSHEDMLMIARWDKQHNHGRVVGSWQPFDHPQLGRIEIGGPDPRYGMWNPPTDRLEEICKQHSSHFLRLAAMAPKLSLRVDKEVDGNLNRLRIRVANLGYLPTNVLASAIKLDHNEPIHIEIIPLSNSSETMAPTGGRSEVGHLDGWGRGLFSGDGALYYQRSRGTSNAKTVSCVIRGSGSVRIRAGSCRVGFVEQTIELG